VLEEVGVKSIEILNEKTDGDSAQVDVRLSYRKAMDERISCTLAKEADGWKIQDFGGDSKKIRDSNKIQGFGGDSKKLGG
jgi:hypothetical protein